MISSRQIHLQDLPGIAARLVPALERSGVPAERLPAVIQAGVTLQCVQCSYALAPEDVLALARPVDPSRADDPKVARLRLHYCARNSCRSHYYQFEVHPHPDVDWAKVEALSEGLDHAAQAAATAEALEHAAVRREGLRRKLLRLGAGLLLVLLLLALRQCHTGGTIPLIREPKRFQADPQSLETSPPR